MNYNNDKEENRILADMSNVEPRNFFGRGFSNKKKENKQIIQLNKEERKWYILGTLKASFLVASVYIIVLGLFILLLFMAAKYLTR